MENIGRNVTLFRMVAVPGTVIPFSKPRYVLRNGALALIDQPTVPPEDVPQTIANFEYGPLAKYEASYAERYHKRWYSPSLLVGTLVELCRVAVQAVRSRGVVLRNLLELTTKITVVAEAVAGAEAIALIPGVVPDVGLLDVRR